MLIGGAIVGIAFFSTDFPSRQSRAVIGKHPQPSKKYSAYFAAGQAVRKVHPKFQVPEESLCVVEDKGSNRFSVTIPNEGGFFKVTLQWEGNSDWRTLEIQE